MILIAAIVAVLLGVIIWRPMRKTILVLAGIIVAAFLVSRYPSSNPSLKSYRLVFGLVSHVAVESLRHGMTQVIHDGHHLLQHYHL